MAESVLFEKFTTKELFEKFTAVEDNMLAIVQRLIQAEKKNQQLESEKVLLLKEREESNRRLEDLLVILNDVQGEPEKGNEQQNRESQHTMPRTAANSASDHVIAKPVLVKDACDH